MCVFLAISLVVGVIWCPRTQGRTLDEITEERYGSQVTEQLERAIDK